MKCCVVTGASAGIGRSLSRRLARRKYRVVLACRSQARGAATLAWIRAELPEADVRVLPLDLESFASVKEFVRRFRELDSTSGLDVLVCNAGMNNASQNRARPLTADGVDQVMQVNHLGHALLVELLLRDLQRAAAPGSPAKVFHVTSAMHRSGRGDFAAALAERRRGLAGALVNRLSGHLRLYGESKLAQILWSQALMERFQGAGTHVVSHAWNPGGVASEIYRDMGWFVRKVGTLFMQSTDSAAASLDAAIHCDELAAASKSMYLNSWRPWPALGPESSLHEYWSPAPCGEDYVVATPAAAARDPDTQARLVRFTQELLAPHLP